MALIAYGISTVICYGMYLFFSVALWVDWIEWDWLGYVFLAGAVAIPVYAVYDIYEAWME